MAIVAKAAKRRTSGPSGRNDVADKRARGLINWSFWVDPDVNDAALGLAEVAGVAKSRAIQDAVLAAFAALPKARAHKR